MPTYLITNRVPRDFRASAEAFAAWTAWFEQLGESLADRGNPAFKATRVGNCETGTALGGYTLVTAGNMEAAVALAQDHPLLTRGGGVEIAELTLLNKGRHLITDPAGGVMDEVVEVAVRIAARPERVFPYLTDPARYVEWMGSQAVLEPVPGGVYRVRMRDGFEAAGTFVEVEAPHRVVFTWGWAGEDAARHVFDEQARQDPAALERGSTRVAVSLEEDGGGTCLTLRHHDLATDALRDAHREAWQTYLGRLAIRAAGGDPGPDPHR
jgi:uncharacterized protein YndB with AHSA1/START domain